MFGTFNRFEIQMTLAQAKEVSHQGQCYEDAAALINNPKIRSQLDKIDPDKIRKELREYGAWDDEELANEKENRIRIVWIAAGRAW